MSFITGEDYLLDELSNLHTKIEKLTQHKSFTVSQRYSFTHYELYNFFWIHLLFDSLHYKLHYFLTCAGWFLQVSLSSVFTSHKWNSWQDRQMYTSDKTIRKNHPAHRRREGEKNTSARGSKQCDLTLRTPSAYYAAAWWLFKEGIEILTKRVPHIDVCRWSLQ